MTQLSVRGAHFIGRFEGWRDRPYNDPTNNATIGFGHLIHMGPVTAHDNAEWGTITMDRGIQLLQQDAAIAENAIEHFIKRQLTQWQRDALASFAFNCGGGALEGSVGAAVNGGGDPSAALEQWDHSGHVVLQGLLERRKQEAHLYLTGDYGDGQAPATNGGSDNRKPKPHPDTVVPDPATRLGLAVGRVEARAGEVQGPRRRSEAPPADRRSRQDPALGLDVPEALPVAARDRANTRVDARCLSTYSLGT